MVNGTSKSPVSIDITLTAAVSTMFFFNIAERLSPD